MKNHALLQVSASILPARGRQTPQEMFVAGCCRPLRSPLRPLANATLNVALQPSNKAQYFNIVTPGSNEAMFVGETTGERAEVVLPTDAPS